jgi:hypothetical protein
VQAVNLFCYEVKVTNFLFKTQPKQLLGSVLLKCPGFGFKVGNCNIDFLIFCHRFQIARLKFMKFERDSNATENF